MERYNRNNLTIALLVINLAAILFFSYRNSQGMDAAIRDIKNEMEELRWEVADRDHLTAQRLEKMMAEQNKDVEEVAFEVAEVDAEALEAQILMKVQLKEKSEGTKVQLIYSAEDGAEMSLEMIETGLLSYEGSAVLSLKEDYKWTLVESGGNSAKILNPAPGALNLASQYYENRGINNTGSGSYGSEDFYMEDQFTFELLSPEVMGPKKIERILMQGGRAIETTDVTEDFLLGEDLEALYRQRDQEAGELAIFERSSISSSAATARQDGMVEMTYAGETTTLYGLYYFRGTYEAYGLESGEQLGVCYRIAYEDGYVQEF